MATIASARTSAEAKPDPARGNEEAVSCSAMYHPRRRELHSWYDVALPRGRRTNELQKAGLTRRAWLLGASAGIGALAGRQCLSPTSHAGPRFPDSQAAGTANVLDDASQLSPTPVASHLTISEDPRSRCGRAHSRRPGRGARGRRPFIASAARHSMGGQSLARDGTVVTLDQQWLETDTARKTYRVAAGTRWSTVIARLDALGFSPAVMQSNNDFGVASTFSVNAHGWPVPFSGCGSTVRRADDGAGGWHGGHLLAHRERRSVPSRDGRLRAVRRDHRARARHGAQCPAHADIRRDDRPRARRAIRAAACRPTRRSRWPTAAWTSRSTDSSSRRCW